MALPRITRFNKISRLFVWIFGAVFGITLLCVALILGLFYATVPLHHLSLWRIEQALSSSISHPADSALIERHSFFGSRYTDISECTYVAGEFRLTPLSREELLAKYGSSTMSILGFARRMPVHVIIVNNDTSLPLDEPAGDWIYDFVQRVDTRWSNTTYYLVYLYEKGRSPWGDYRCWD